jgi:Restriction endonuclease
MTYPKDWPAYERLVGAVKRCLDPDAEVKWNEKVPGIRSQHPRQLDIVVRGRVGSSTAMVVVECKDYSTKKVDIELVDAFLGKLSDIGASKGILVTRVGFTKPALRRAHADGVITALLRPARDEDWEDYQRSITVKVVSRVTLLEELKIELVDGRVIEASDVHQLRDDSGKATFLDRLVHGYLSSAEWDEGEPIRLMPQGMLYLLLDDEQPEVAKISCCPRWSDGYEVEAMHVAPEDWVFFNQGPSGQSDEKYFFELIKLAEAARSFEHSEANPT